MESRRAAVQLNIEIFLSADTENWTVMEKLSVLGTESVIIVSLMATTSVFLIGKHQSLRWTFITIYLFPATIVFLYLGIKVKNI